MPSYHPLAQHTNLHPTCSSSPFANSFMLPSLFYSAAHLDPLFLSFYFSIFCPPSILFSLFPSLIFFLSVLHFSIFLFLFVFATYFTFLLFRLRYQLFRSSPRSLSSLAPFGSLISFSLITFQFPSFFFSLFAIPFELFFLTSNSFLLLSLYLFLPILSFVFLTFALFLISISISLSPFNRIFLLSNSYSFLSYSHPLYLSFYLLSLTFPLSASASVFRCFSFSFPLFSLILLNNFVFFFPLFSLFLYFCLFPFPYFSHSFLLSLITVPRFLSPIHFLSLFL